ncbi:Leucine-rich alpha-2-glycoprotein [Nibea albiflora]|uniref:Leucine-rich alpha-2-glycoprotein n=1 Tax=Nibea albiflora TaxID=240163 RepID=A0ACB7EEJ3_NIBAL|nr:Leucine-rich alpha-2-glycoprotein [Nibea albiflora]
MKSWRALAFLWLACFCRGALSCPALCKCYQRRAEVVCNEVPLTEYPSEGLPKNTTMLTIQFTSLSSISEEQLSATPLLQGLHLYNNHLQNLSADLLRGVPQLDTLDLTENKLSKLAQLRILSLDDNQLSHIPAGLLDPLLSLDDDGLDLSDNPWLCDGKNEYLWRWLQKNKKKVFLPEGIVCAGPESLKKRTVMSLTESEINAQS